MTRDKAERAMKRMKDFCSINEDFSGALNLLFENIQSMEVWLRAVMEFEIDELDHDSKTWFIDDEEEYNKRLEEIKHDIDFRVRFVDAMCRIDDELEEEEN